MIKIAFVIGTIETPGAGTEKQLLRLLADLDRTRFQPHLVCLRPSPWLESQSLPFPVTVLHVGRMKSPAFLTDLRRMTKFLQREQFHLVQTFFPDGNIYGTVTAKLAGIPVIVSSRRNIGYWHTPLHLAILRLFGRWTDHYLANSRAVVDKTIEAEKVDPAKLTLIYNGIDLDRFAQPEPDARKAMRAEWGIRENEILVGSVANLRPVKNLETLIGAVAELSEKDERLRLVVVGEGDQRAVYQKLIDSRGLSSRFHLVGSYEDVAGCLAAFDIGVLASHSESFSNSLIEYMAAGLPIVASAVGGNVEAIDHERTGLLFDPSDQPALTEACRRLIEDSEYASSLGRAARSEAMSKYAWPTCLAAHEHFYSRVGEGIEK